MDKLSDYDYELPEGLIAKYPLKDRLEARLLVIDRARGTFLHRQVKDLPECLSAGDLMIANRSKVIHARLRGKRLPTGGGVECFLLRRDSSELWECLLKTRGRVKEGFQFEVETKGAPLIGLVQQLDRTQGTRWVQFSREPQEADGDLPLPPYLGRETEPEDKETYQCVYAKEPGSVAAPTAGLHLTEHLLKRIQDKGILFETLLLHVGLGTFRPVKAQRLDQHVMHEEHFEVSERVRDLVLARQGRLIAVGTTSLRALESAWQDQTIKTGPQKTSLFLRPGGEARIQLVDGLLTNFHLPKSSLLMLVASFAGLELTRAAYEEAIREKYRFFSYGDACLIL